LRREPRYFGRAEALLAAKAAAPGAGAGLRRLYAETLQFRHAFAPAESLLDALLREQPHAADTRLRRGSLRLTRGDFAGARSDCAQLALARGSSSPAGFACLAEALAGSGELERARILLDSMARDTDTLDPAARAYLLATRAELGERAGDIAAAIEDYSTASRLAPQDDSIRAALADALALRGDPDAAAPLAVEGPSLALLVRQAALARNGDSLRNRARDWLQLEMARGDAIHYREAAMLALAERKPGDALAAARRNFESQRELADVRVLARAAVAARDAGAQGELRQWLTTTGYQDAITAGILADASGG
jgi:predicted Zn-dependent protease